MSLALGPVTCFVEVVAVAVGGIVVVFSAVVVDGVVVVVGVELVGDVVLIELELDDDDTWTESLVVVSLPAGNEVVGDVKVALDW